MTPSSPSSNLGQLYWELKCSGSLCFCTVISRLFGNLIILPTLDLFHKHYRSLICIQSAIRGNVLVHPRCSQSLILKVTTRSLDSYWKIKIYRQTMKIWAGNSYGKLSLVYVMSTDDRYAWWPEETNCSYYYSGDHSPCQVLNQEHFEVSLSPYRKPTMWTTLLTWPK